MPTPLAYDGILYVGRQRLQRFADGKIYLSNEDGEMLVVDAGRQFRLIAANAIGELLMATPALSDGVMYVRSSSSVFAIGKPRR